MIVPNPISFLPQIISITKNPRFRRIKNGHIQFPHISASAITIPLKGSFPSPESLNIAIPKPRIIFPINITTTYFQFIFLIHSLISFSSVKLTLSIISDSKILYNILSVNCFPLFYCDFGIFYAKTPRRIVVCEQLQNYLIYSMNVTIMRKAYIGVYTPFYT